MWPIVIKVDGNYLCQNFLWEFDMNKFEATLQIIAACQRENWLNVRPRIIFKTSELKMTVLLGTSSIIVCSIRVFLHIIATAC